MKANVRDLALFLGYKSHPRELSPDAVAELEAAEGRLATTHPESLLELMLTLQKSGLRAIRPPLPDRVLGAQAERNPAAGRRFQRPSRDAVELSMSTHPAEFKK